MKTLPVHFNSGTLSLEGVLGIPDSGGQFPAVIICHPHPLYGGSMDNNVVMSLSDALLRASLITFRFNFRGVGGSQGSYSNGTGEEKDVDAAISFVAGRKEVDVQNIGLAGYSAGAAFGMPAGCRESRVRALAAVSPPLAMSDFAFLTHCAKPKFIISGSEDDFTPAQEFNEFCQRLPPPMEHYCVEGADHFWWGHEKEIAEKAADFFVRELKR
jgi:uncharacterized protein